MEVGIGSIVLIVLVVWYLGSSINAIISKSGAMAEDEFNQFRRAQKYRIAKGNAELKLKVKDLDKDAVMTDEELDKALGLA